MREHDNGRLKAVAPEQDAAAWEPATEALDAALTLISKLDLGTISSTSLLSLYSTIRSSRDRLSALTSTILGHADRTGAAMVEEGLSTGTWLSQSQGVNGWQAQRDLRIADSLQRHEHVRNARCDGKLSEERAAAVARVLSRLPDELSAKQRLAAESHLVSRAEELSVSQIADSIDELILLVAPDDAERHASNRPSRERAHAIRDRYVTIRRDGRGMTHIRAGLPDAEGARIQQVVDAIGAHSHHRALNSRYPGGDDATVTQRRADALTTVFETVHHDLNKGKNGQKVARGPGKEQIWWGLTRAHTQLRVTLTLEQLVNAFPGAHTAGGHTLSPGELRRLACDSEILPAVLGGESELLDLGRTTRTVPKHLRDALAYRDQGCAFPGCDVAEPYCEAHHIKPWQEGGATSLDNLTLLCSHHHGTIEPHPGQQGRASPKQWEARIAKDGVPEFLTPAKFGTPREAHRNSRFRNHPLLA